MIATLTVDTLALLFELEICCANTRCNNCGKRGLTLLHGSDARTVIDPPLVKCTVETICLRCEFADHQDYTFENPKFIV